MPKIKCQVQITETRENKDCRSAMLPHKPDLAGERKAQSKHIRCNRAKINDAKLETDASNRAALKKQGTLPQAVC